MGSGDWFKKVIRLKKSKGNRSNQSKRCTEFSNGACNGKARFLGMSAEDIAATRIQTAFRAYKARKNLRYLKGKVRLKMLIESHSVGKQASSTLVHLHSWSRIQSEIRARRLAMVTEDRIRQKKLDSQLKLEAKLHDLEVEWCGGSETMEETLARIHQREEAAIKRERTLAYAFSHQWRANSGSNLGPPELGKANWGWSWMERWIAARPWESRVLAQKSPVKPISRTPSKACKNTTTPTIKPLASSAKIISPNGKGPTKARRLSYPAAEKPSPPSNAKVGPDRVETGQLIC